MKKRKIEDDRYIINIGNKYYVVNEDTYELINQYNKNHNKKEIAKKLNISKWKVSKYLKTIKKEIEKGEYYENNIDLDFPLKIQWKITNRCNLKCKHCYLGELSNTQLEEKELMDIAKKIAQSNTMEVTITGGEALMVKCLPEIVLLLLDNDIKVNIFTNALLLDKFEKRLCTLTKEDYTDKLDFFISVDGLEKSHDNIRGKGNFKKTMANIQTMVEKGYRITTNSVLSTMNYKDIPELYKKLCEIGVYKIQISNIIDSGNATSNMKLTEEQHDEFLEELKNVLKDLDRGSKLLYADMPDEECNSEIYMLGDHNKEYLQTEQWKCSAGIGKCTIEYNGDVYCCPFIRNYKLGNLLDQEIHKIWKNPKRFDFLKLIAKENNNSRVCIAAKQRIANNSSSK